jgi:lysozyme
MTTEVLTTGIVDWHFSDGAYDLVAFKAAGGVAGIVKATEGGDFRDKGFAKAMEACKVAGILRGAYHFANGKTDPAKQADHFLSVVAPYPDALLVLDLESNEKSSFGTMSFARGAAFMQRIHDKTGRWPVFYTYESMLHAEMRKASPEVRAVLGRGALWIAKYGSPPKPIPASWCAWADWSMWQYSSGPGNGPSDKVRYPRGVPAFKDPVQDRSAWRGDAESLAVWWKTAGLEVSPRPSAPSRSSRAWSNSRPSTQTWGANSASATTRAGPRV